MIASVWTSAGAALLAGVPVDPDAPTAKDLLLRELSKPVYEAARPSWFDRLASAIWDWVSSLFGHGPNVGGVVPAILLAGIAGLIVAAILVFGIPRLRHRSARRPGVLDGTAERTPEQIRSSAASAAARADWSQAVVETFRACMADLDRRTLLSLLPGTTAHEASRQAGEVFPDLTPELGHAAAVFDAVRYLGRGGDEQDYLRMRRLDDDLQAHKPPVPAASEAVVS